MSLVEEVLAKINIIDVVSKYVDLKKVGANYFGLCPFHSDTNPSLCVSIQKGIFKCFSCGASGNAITFLQKIKKISFIDALKEVATMAGFSSDEINSRIYANFSQHKKYSNLEKLITINQEANDLFNVLLIDELNKDKIQYLKNRCFSDKIIKFFEFGFCGLNNDQSSCSKILLEQNDNKNDIKDKISIKDLANASLLSIDDKSDKITDYFYNRITIPIKDKYGTICGFIGRSIIPSKHKYLINKDTQLFEKNKFLFNFNHVYSSNCSTIIILEGPLDLISLYETDIINDNIVPVALMGATLSNNQLNLIKSVKSIKNILLCLDNDQAGILATINIGLQFLFNKYQNVEVLLNKTDCKDINEILIKNGRNKINELFGQKNRIDFISFYIEYELKNNSTNKVEIIEKILSLVIEYANPLFYSKYKKLISIYSGFEIEDINLAMQKMNVNRFKSNNYIKILQNNNDNNISNNTNIYAKLLLENFQKFMEIIFCQSTLAIQTYDKIDINKYYFHFVQDSYFLIKYLATLKNNQSFDNIKNIITQLVKDNKISEQSQKKFDCIIQDCINKINKNINKSHTLNKAIELIKKINFYFNKLQFNEIKAQLIDLSIDDIEKDELSNKLKLLKNKITKYY